MPENPTLGLAAAKARTADQVQREEAGRAVDETDRARDQSVEPGNDGARPSPSLVKSQWDLFCGCSYGWTTPSHCSAAGSRASSEPSRLTSTVVLRGPGHIWRTPNLQGEDLELFSPPGMR